MYKPPLKWILEPAGAFPVRRGKGDEEAMERAVELAKSGEVVAIFPEGTRGTKAGSRRRSRKPPRETRTGAARVAIAAGVPLVPAAIGGTESLLKLGPPRRLRAADRARRSQGFGHPEASKIATERLMESIHELEKTL